MNCVKIKNKLRRIFAYISKRTLLSLIFISMLTGLLVFWNLGSWIPIFADEASILVSAKEEYYNFSLFSLNEWYGNMDLQIVSLFFHVFGVGLFAGRLIEAISSVLTVMLTFLIAQRLYGESVGLTAAFFLALSPFHIFFSRLAMKYSLLTLCEVLSIFLLIYGMHKRSRGYVFLSFFVACVALRLTGAQAFFLLPILFVYVLISYGPSYILKNRRILLLLVVGLAAVFVITLTGFKIQTLRSLVNMFFTYEEMTGLDFSSFDAALSSILYVAGYTRDFLTYPVFLLFLLGAVLAICNMETPDLLVLTWMVAGWPLLFFAFFPRRILPLIPAMMILAARFTIWVPNILKYIPLKVSFHTSRKMTSRYLVSLLIVVLVGFESQCFSCALIENPVATPLPSIIREVYIEEHYSGYGIPEMVNFIRENIMPGATIVTDQTDKLEFYLSEHYGILNINKYGSLSFPETFRRAIADNTERTYFVFRDTWIMKDIQAKSSLLNLYGCWNCSIKAIKAIKVSPQGVVFSDDTIRIYEAVYVPPLKPKQVFYDTFSDYSQNSDGSPIWIPLTGMWVVEGDKYGTTGGWTIYPGNFTDFIYTFDINVKKWGSVGWFSPRIPFRIGNDGAHYYELNIRKSGAYLFIGKGEKYEMFASNQSVSFLANKTYTVKIEAKGGLIKIYQDDNMIISATDSTYSSGAIGLASTGDAHVYYDNVNVTSIDINHK